MTYEVPDIPRITAGTAKALNRLYAGAPSVSFTMGGREWRFAPDGAARPNVWRVRVYARVGDHNLALFLDSLLPADWEGSNLPLPLLSALPPELAGAALEMACADLAESLEHVCGHSVTCTGVNLEEEPAWLPDEGFLFTLTRDDGQTVPGALAAEPSCLAFLADLLAPTVQTAGRDLASLVLHCRVLFPGPVLTAGELSDLAAGDILLTKANTDEMEHSGLAVRLTLSDTCGAPAKLRGTQLHMEGFMTDETAGEHMEAAEQIPGEEMADRPENENDGPRSAPVPDAPASLLNTLPLRVGFDLGGVELTLAEVGALAPGQILSTGRDAAHPVVITVSGKSVGTGSLVDVAGHIGIRVETLSLK